MLFEASAMKYCDSRSINLRKHLSFDQHLPRMCSRYEGPLRIAAQRGQLHVGFESIPEGGIARLAIPAAISPFWQIWEKMMRLYMTIQLACSPNIPDDGHIDSRRQ
jgi:hypothetical protein